MRMPLLSPSVPPTAPSLVGESPCSDGACSTGVATAAAAKGRGRRCHYGRTVITFLSFIGIPELKYMYVGAPMFVLYSCTENCSLNALSRPIAPSVVSGSPCSDDAGWMGAATAAITGRGQRCHYGLMDGHLLSFISMDS